jgi:hypothetical protein
MRDGPATASAEDGWAGRVDSSSTSHDGSRERPPTAVCRCRLPMGGAPDIARGNGPSEGEIHGDWAWLHGPTCCRAAIGLAIFWGFEAVKSGQR